jgi:hypothetical protein
MGAAPVIRLKKGDRLSQQGKIRGRCLCERPRRPRFGMKLALESYRKVRTWPQLKPVEGVNVVLAKIERQDAGPLESPIS